MFEIKISETTNNNVWWSYKMKKIIALYKRYIAPIPLDKCAALSYYSLLALLPGLYILFYCVQLFHISLPGLQNFLNQILPLSSVKQIIDFAIKQTQTSKITAIVVIISSLVILSQGVYVFIKYINNLFSIQEASFLQLRIRAFFIALFLVMTLAFLLIALMFIFPILTNQLPIFIYYFILFLIYVLIHFILVLLLIKFCLLKNISFSILWKGLLFFSITASLLYLLFSPFIRIFANNYASYGPLAGFASILIFFYVYFVLLFIAVNISAIEYHLKRTDVKLKLTIS